MKYVFIMVYFVLDLKKIEGLECNFNLVLIFFVNAITLTEDETKFIST